MPKIKFITKKFKMKTTIIKQLTSFSFVSLYWWLFQRPGCKKEKLSDNDLLQIWWKLSHGTTSRFIQQHSYATGFKMQTAAEKRRLQTLLHSALPSHQKENLSWKTWRRSTLFYIWKDNEERNIPWMRKNKSWVLRKYQQQGSTTAYFKNE